MIIKVNSLYELRNMLLELGIISWLWEGSYHIEMPKEFMSKEELLSIAHTLAPNKPYKFEEGITNYYLTIDDVDYFTYEGKFDYDERGILKNWRNLHND